MSRWVDGVSDDYQATSQCFSRASPCLLLNLQNREKLGTVWVGLGMDNLLGFLFPFLKF